MNLLFLQDHGLNESLALTELSSFLKAAGHSTDLVLLKDERHPWERARDVRPGLVVVAASILAPKWALDTARKAATHLGAPVVLAGTLPTLVPGVVREPAVDFACVGEAELPIQALCRAMESDGDMSDLPGIRAASNGKSVLGRPAPALDRLDSAPMPDRDLYFNRYDYIRRFAWKKFLAGRGCIYSCHFCYLSGLRQQSEDSGPHVRMKSPERIVSEIEVVRDRAPLKAVHFSDDLFGLRPEWLEEFAELYSSRIGVPFTCNTCAELLSDRAVRLLRRAGCRGVAMGVEVGSADRRREELNKKTPDETYLRAADRLHAQGIRLMSLNMIGLPGERREDLWSLVDLNVRMRSDASRVQYAVPLPGTPYGDRAGGNGSRTAEDQPDVSEYGPVPRFGSDHEGELRNVYSAFRLMVSFPAAIPLIRSISRWVPAGSLAWMNAAMMVNEKRFSGIGWWEAFRYWLNVGSPNRRTTNFPSLI